MSLDRRMELFLGGPARPFDLTVTEADLLASAIEAYKEEKLALNKTSPAENAEDSESDSEILAKLHELQARLREHAGFSRNQPKRTWTMTVKRPGEELVSFECRARGASIAREIGRQAHPGANVSFPTEVKEPS